MASTADPPKTSLDVPGEEGYDSETSQGSELPPYPASRRGSESSTERSLYDEKDQAVLNAYAPGGGTSNTVQEEYALYHPSTLSRGLVITGPKDGNASVPLYYSEVSGFTKNKPDTTLHAIPGSGLPRDDLDHCAKIGETGPVLGVAHLPRFSSHIHAGLGDPNSGANVRWLDLKNPRRPRLSEHQFTYNGRNLSWQRTKDPAHGVEGGSVKRTLDKGSRVLVDDTTGEVFAVFLVNNFKSWKKRGKLRFLKGMEALSPPEREDMKLVVFVTITGILEKARRRRNRTAVAGAGATGGGG